MRKALFWDFDGTLSHSKGSAQIIDGILKKRGFEIPLDEIKQYVHAILPWWIPEKSYTEHTGEPWWDWISGQFEPLYEKYKLQERDRANVASDFKKSALNPANYVLYDDALSTLSRCVELGYENYVLSNNFPGFASVVSALGLSEYLRGCVISADIGYEKPRIEIFDYALALAGRPRECWMIGDSPAADIAGGRAAGMKTILVHSERESEADYACASLGEVPAAVVPPKTKI